MWDVELRNEGAEGLVQRPGATMSGGRAEEAKEEGPLRRRRKGTESEDVGRASGARWTMGIPGLCVMGRQVTGEQKGRSSLGWDHGRPQPLRKGRADQWLGTLSPRCPRTMAAGREQVSGRVFARAYE